MTIRRVVLALAANALLAGCAGFGQPWTLTVLSQADEDLVVVVENRGHTGTWLVPAWTEDEVLIRQGDRASGPIRLLDARTCEILATESIPAGGRSVLVTFWLAHTDLGEPVGYELSASDWGETMNNQLLPRANVCRGEA